MVAELRQIGRKRLALYTDDNRVYQRFSRWSGTINKVPYIQNNRQVAIDLYFDSKAGSAVRLVLNGQLWMNI